MTTQTIEALWKERAVRLGKTDASGNPNQDYVTAHSREFPPDYQFELNWAAAQIQPAVFDPFKDGPTNERQFYRELLNLTAQNFAAVQKRMTAADRANAKRIDGWLKRIKAEEPSNELLSQYATYRPIIESYSEAAKAAETTADIADEEFDGAMRELSKHFYKVMNNGQSLLYDVKNDAWTKYEDCITHYGHRSVSYFDEALGKRVTKNIFQAYKGWDSPTRYDRVQFNPRKAGHYDDVFNLYQGFSTKPEPGDDDLMVWDLLLRACGNNEEYFDYVQKWFAHMVQKPWDLPGTCLGLSGPQRIGKNVLIETFGMLVASQSMVDAINKQKSDKEGPPLGSVLGSGGFGLYTSYDHVFGTFNYSTGSKLLLLMDEATWPGSNALKARFKTAVTGATTTIADKFVKSIEIDNCRRFVLLSNNGDYLGVDADDGRLLPLEFKEEFRPSKEWFSEYCRLRREGKMIANLMHRLQNVDLTGWQPMAALRELEITTGQALQAGSSPDHVDWIEDIAENGTRLSAGDKEQPYFRLPTCGTFVSIDDLRESFVFYSKQTKPKGWNTFCDLRDKLFGPKVQRRIHGQRSWGHEIPEQVELQRRFNELFRWKHNRFSPIVDDELANKKQSAKVLALSERLLNMGVERV